MQKKLHGENTNQSKWKNNEDNFKFSKKCGFCVKKVEKDIKMHFNDFEKVDVKFEGFKKEINGNIYRLKKKIESNISIQFKQVNKHLELFKRRPESYQKSTKHKNKINKLKK